jgi:oxidase EvaA
VLHFLVQARTEPGLWNQVELAPTIQHLSGAVEHEKAAGQRYLDLLEELKQGGIRHSSIQSEEGGRFYHYQNRYLVVEAPPDTVIDELPNFHWMTLGQINVLMMYGNYLNIEARSLLACLALGDDG